MEQPKAPNEKAPTLKQTANGKKAMARPYDLEERTLAFARDARRFLKLIPRTLCNIEDAKQFVRSSGSVGANYIEANEALGKKDALLRLRIARKEAKESKYWLELLDIGSQQELSIMRDALSQEASELLCIISAIIRKTE